MYTDFYKLVAEPFQLTPDHRFFFGSSVHSQALAHLSYGLQQGEGFIVITGDIGAGKTTLVSQLLATLDSRKYITAKVVTTQLDADDLLRTVVTAFGVKADFNSKADMLRQMEGFFTVTFRAGKRCLLLIDEAQNLTPQALEELRMLSNFQVGEKTPLQSFILGQPQFRALLNSPELEQLRQRIIANYHLGPLDPDETRKYIEHRLLTAGWQQDDPSITPEAFQALHKHTEGVPRRINGLCNRLFLYGFLEEKHAFDEADVDRVARDLNREENPDIRGKDLVGLPRNQRSPVLHLDHARLEEMARRLEAVESREPSVAPADTRTSDELRRRVDMLEEYIRLRSVADRTYDDMMRRLGVLEEARAATPPPAPPLPDPSPRLQALEERLGQIGAPDTARIEALEARLNALPPPAAPAEDPGPRLQALEERLAGLPPPADTGGLESRIALLEARPQAPPVDTAWLEGRIAALENRAPDGGRIEEVERRLSALAPPADTSWLEGRIAALENRSPAQPDMGRIEALEQRLNALPAAAPDTGWLADRLAALESRPAAQPDMEPLFDRLATLESRMNSLSAGLGERVGSVEGRLNTLPAPTDNAGIIERLVALESRPAAAPEMGRIEALEQRLATMVSPAHADTGALERRLAALESRPAGGPAPAIDNGRLEALELRLAAQPVDLVDRIGKLEQALRADESSLGGRLDALEAKAAAPQPGAAMLLDRLEALEKRDSGAPLTYVAAIEARLSSLETAPAPGIDAAAVEALSRRLSQIESTQRAAPPAGLLDEVKGRLTALEQSVAATSSTGGSVSETRDMDQRLDSLERKLTAQEAMLRRAIGLAAALLERGRPQEAQDAR